MTTPSIEQLENEIEQLVRTHMAACEVAASAAVRRAFASAQAQPATKGKATEAPKTRKRASPGRRRTTEEVAKLADRLYEVVSANPGEGMQVLAADMDATTRELHRPMMVLKKAGRVRSAGRRQHTRYFPMAEREAQPHTP